MTDERICVNGHVIDEGKPLCSRCNEPEDKKAEEAPAEKEAEVEKAEEVAADETEKTDEEKVEASDEAKMDEADVDKESDVAAEDEARAPQVEVLLIALGAGGILGPIGPELTLDTKLEGHVIGGFDNDLGR